MESNVQRVIDAEVQLFENKPFNSPTGFFSELLELSKEWDNFKFPTKKDSEERENDEIKDWIYHSGKKVLLLEKIRRKLIFMGVSGNLIKEELIKLNKYLLNNDSRLKLKLNKRGIAC